MSRSQEGLHRRGRDMSNGTPPPGAPGFRAPPPPADLVNLVSYDSFVLSNGAVRARWAEPHPAEWFIDAAAFYGVGLGISTQVDVRNANAAVNGVFRLAELVNQPNARQDISNPRGPNGSMLAADMQMRTRILFCKQIPSQPWAVGEVVATWAISPWVLVGTVATAEPEDDEQLDERLALLTTHAALDAWVQAHEANLPCRPDEWPSYNLAVKREWVITNYTPDTLPAEDADAFDLDPDDRDE